MDKKYQIFISSTYIDLIEQRQAVLEAILRMGHLPVGMERFDAADESQWEVIKRHIDNSDYYVLIIARRYGSEDPASGLSYTHKEYRYALERGVPCIAFMLDNSVKDWNNDYVDSGKTKKKLDAFKAEFKNRLVNFWTDSKDLAFQTYASLSTLITRQPRVGWVRGSEAASSQVAEELSRLSKENNELKKVVALQGAQKDEIDEARNILDNHVVEIDSAEKPTLSLSDIFKVIGPKMISKISQYRISTVAEREIRSLGFQDKEYFHNELLFPLLEKLTVLDITTMDFDSSNGYSYVLTTKGKALLARLKY